MNKQQKNWQIKLIFTDSYFKKLCVANHGCEIRSEKITFSTKIIIIMTLIVHYFTKFLKKTKIVVFKCTLKANFYKKKGISLENIWLRSHLMTTQLSNCLKGIKNISNTYNIFGIPKNQSNQKTVKVSSQEFSFRFLDYTPL